MVTGIDLFARKEERCEDQSGIKSKNENKFTADSKSSTSRKPRAELILRLRIDRRVLESGASRKVDQKPNDSNHEEQPALFGTLGDGKSTIRVMLLNPDGVWSTRLKREKAASNASTKKETICDFDWIVKVHGYAATEKFWHMNYRIFPVICLTSISILGQCEKGAHFDSHLEKKSSKAKSSSTSTLGKPFFLKSTGGSSFLPAKCKAQGGTIGTFLKERGPFLTNEELAGSSKILDESFDDAMTTVLNDENSTTMNNVTTKETFSNQNFKKVHDCLSRHSAMLTLQQSSSSISCSTSNTSTDHNNTSSANSSAAVPGDLSDQTTATHKTNTQPTQYAWELYEGALSEFVTIQMDRQKASLGTNIDRESAERAKVVVERHNFVLQLALNEKGPLSIDLLLKWHRELLRGLHPEAGIIRTRKVRCGHTTFCPPERIRRELELYCAGLQSLELRLDLENNALHAILYGAVAMFGIVDIHAFLDGNGRLSRIVANYALKKLPFPINLFATATQRSEYVVAIERTRHLLSINCAYGDVSRDDLIQVLKATGVFGCLVQLLIDRVARAATALTAIWEEKSGLAAEAAEAKAARRVRERASRGTCMICLDEKPNIATLCCGNAIHLNCCAEWLSRSNKCPICRHEMPSINKRVVRAFEEPEELWEIGDDDSRLSESIERTHPAMLSREYQNLVGGFWHGDRYNRRRIGRSVRQPPDPFPRSLLSDSESEDSDSHHSLSIGTTTTTTSEEDVDETGSVVTNRRSNMEPNRDEMTTDTQNIRRPRVDEQGEHDDTTTAFSEDVNHTDTSDSTTTTAGGSEVHGTTTMEDSDISSQEQRQRPFPTICAASAVGIARLLIVLIHFVVGVVS
eukprot:CAMPEP_0197178014 /NCGR_PEP_ID=MMETSP1423-20130617/3420_1 /TAXON_ID=476441 /ORGANISM="Pseudo-nitzschia heimii, Strain UNC1101" /LENGTH=860 /DNA_ID=CAMNT_0042627657 /DNA_START=392 /DNA_END=2975 /DNA_ORIENTATION=-